MSGVDGAGVDGVVPSGGDLARRLRELRLFVFDVDGVLTDGGIFMGPGELELKRFAIQDGTAFKMLEVLGKEAVLLSGRQTEVVLRRARELGVSEVIQDMDDKEACLEELCRARGIAMEHVFYQGDDLIDLPAMRRVGCPVAPANAAPEVRRAALYVTPRGGGFGAARDAVDWVLRTSGEYDAALEGYARAKREAGRG